ncbi:jouberin-like isoform X2 [Rhodnius prolixus]
MKDRQKKAEKSGGIGEAGETDLKEMKSGFFSKVPSEKRGSLTETMSDSDSGKIKLVPLRPISARRRAPAGSATETLSEDSDEKAVSPKFTHPLPPIPPRRKSVPLAETNAVVRERPKSAVVQTTVGQEVILSPPPVPAPRKSISKSVEQVVSPYCTSSSMDYKDTDVLSNSKLRKPKKKRKLRDAKESGEGKSNAISSTESLNHSSNKPTPTKELEMKKDEEMACVTVHSCEPLHVKHFHSRHVVRLHVMDLTSGKYKKSALGKMDIQPVNTSPFDYKEQRSTMPTWEEDLFVLEPLAHIVSVGTMLIFEVADSQNEEVIAWAFLKPVAANGALNAGKTLRLQLYKPGKQIKDKSIPQGFQWWSRAKYTNYKSTLFITVNGVPSHLIVTPPRPDILAEPKGENLENQEEGVEDHLSVHSDKKEDSDLEEVVWNRLPSLSCKLPNAIVATLDTGNSKSMAVAYSHSGLYLASQTGENLCMLTFKGRLSFTMSGHQGLVYCLKWSKDDKYLLSSSADTTTCVWDVGNRKSTPLQVLSHPSYVYSCCWLDESAGLIVTACYDQYIRLWKLGTKSPIQHLSKHTCAVNSVAVIDNYTLVSGDNVGLIILWRLTEEGILEFEREIILREVKGKSINKLIIHSGKKRMLVHTRDSVLRMVDIATGCVVQWFRGGLNNRIRCDSCFCGCGSRIFATCEDGSTCCWDAHTGQMIALYTRLQSNCGTASIDFHPRDHYMALASHSSLGTASLSIVHHDRDSSGKEVGIVYMDAPLHQDLEASSQSLNSSHSGSHPSLVRDTPCSSPSGTSTDGRKSRRKDFGIFKALLGRKKNKKGNSNNSNYQATDVESKDDTLQKKHRKMTPTMPHSGQDSTDHRLTDIIKRMDKILTAISSNRPI